MLHSLFLNANVTVRSRQMDIYCIAIGGTGMAPLACLLQEEGHRVRGSDAPLYPPMSLLLDRAGICPLVGFDPRHLDPPPDLVIVGNAVRRDNPEAVEAERLGLGRMSMPQALYEFFLRERRPLVVAGTHGKTTTAAMAAWVYTACGQDPGYLVGGWPVDLAASFRRGSGSRFIVEGDEYNAAYFDRGPKFLHYRPDLLILTGVEYDHADLYPTPEALHHAYASLLQRMPERGRVVAWGDSPEVRDLARQAPCPVVFYGFGEENAFRIQDGVESGPWGSRFRIADPEVGAMEVTLPLWGDHNAANALAVWAAARHDSLSPQSVGAALGRFHGVRRRLEELGTAGEVTVVDDFAHHPTAVGATLAALRRRYPGRRLVALFEPRSLTAGRRCFQDAYRSAFSLADRVLLAPIYHQGRLSPEEVLDLSRLAEELASQGVETTVCDEVEEVFRAALADARPGDVLVTMSSGDFGGLPRRLLEALGVQLSPGSSLP